MIDAIPVTNFSAISDDDLSYFYNKSNDINPMDGSTLYFPPVEEGEMVDMFTWLLLLLGVIAISVLLYFIFEKILFRNRRKSLYLKVEERRIRVRPPIVY